MSRSATLRQALGCLDQQGANDRFEVSVVADAGEQDFAAVASAVRGRSYPARALQPDTAGAALQFE